MARLSRDFTKSLGSDIILLDTQVMFDQRIIGTILASWIIVF